MMNDDTPRRRYTLPRSRAQVMAARAEAIMTYNPELRGYRSRAFMERWQRYCDRAAALLLDAPGASDGESLADDVDQWLRGDQE